MNKEDLPSIGIIGDAGHDKAVLLASILALKAAEKITIKPPIVAITASDIDIPNQEELIIYREREDDRIWTEDISSRLTRKERRKLERQSKKKKHE